MALVEELAARGVAPPPWQKVVQAVDRSATLADPYGALADLDAPLPEPGDEAGFSPRGAVLALRALDVDEGDDVLVAGPGGAYARALAEARAGSATHVRDLSEAEGTWDRILLTREARSVPDGALDLLEPLGTLLVRRPVPDDVEVVKHVRSGGEAAEVRLDDATPADDPWGSRGQGPTPDRRLATLLGFEGALQRVWTGTVRGHRERRWLEAVEGIWREDPPDEAGEAAWDRARDLFRIGYALQQATDLPTARRAYTASLELAASAEAHTFRGWVESFRGRYREAIEECKRAIDVDPSLGNPYNDIGCYLLELGRVEEAEGWFESAMDADRYEAPHYPHLNLARVRLHEGDVEGARSQVERCLEIEPGDPAAEALLRRIRDEERR